MYAPGGDRWLEVSSIGWFTDFQARRANIRYRPQQSKDVPKPKLAHVHTVNGSVLATPRTMVALVEQYVEADGRLAIPETLRPYLGGLTHLNPKPEA